MAELLAAIGAQPDDPDPQLVLADHLLSAGDPRGELIVLDHLERRAPGGLTDPEAIERLLVLAATYGFPCARDEVEPMLPFTGSDDPAYYPAAQAGPRRQLHHEGHHYIVVCDHRGLHVSVDGEEVDEEVDDELDEEVGDLEDILDDSRGELPRGVIWTFSAATFSGQWTDEERDVVLTLLSDAIRAGTPLSELQIPYVGEPLPQYPGAPLRAYWLPESFVAAHGLSRDRHGLAARDYHRWHALWERLQRLPPPER